MKIFDNIRRLGPGWNGYEAGPFNPDFVNRVEAIARKIPFRPQIFPTARNSIQFEFTYGGEYLEIEFHENGEIGVYWESIPEEDGSTSYREWECGSVDEALNAIRLFHGSS